VPASAHESLLAAGEQLSSLKGSAYAVVRNTAVIGGRSPARRPVAGEHVKASMHSSLWGTLARTARFHDDGRPSPRQSRHRRR